MIVRMTDTAMMIGLTGSEDEGDAVDEDDDIDSMYKVAFAGVHGELENADDEHPETGESTDEEMNVFQGKDFTGARHPPSCSSSQREHNSASSGCVDEAKNANTPHDAFSLFTSDAILNIILTHTNQKKFMIISSTSLARFRNGCGKHHWMSFVLSLAC
jgi:hypothetical protein